MRAHLQNVAQEEQTVINEPGQWPTQMLLTLPFVRTLRNRLSEVVSPHTALNSSGVSLRLVLRGLF